MLLKLATIKLNKEFKRAYYQGKFKAHPLLVSYQIHNRAGRPRIGITTSKKIGGAVQRNRARRIIRQAFCEISAEKGFPLPNCDFVFVARPLTPSSTTKEVKKVMIKQLTALRKGQ